MLLGVHVNGANVLCIGELGHIEVEVAGSTCCTDKETAAQHAQAPIVEDAGDCGACVDVYFAQDAALLAVGFQPIGQKFVTTSSFPAFLEAIAPLSVDQCPPKLFAVQSRARCFAASYQLSSVIRC